MTTVWRRLRPAASRLLSAIAGLLSELSDESAYRRHLAAYGRPHSPEEWRRFFNHRLETKYQRPKCC